MEFLSPKQYYSLMVEKGLKPSWVASKVGITYNYLNQYFNSKKNMAHERVVTLHKLLVK